MIWLIALVFTAIVALLVKIWGASWKLTAIIVGAYLLCFVAIGATR